jgi:cytidyltransferase-like protein
MHDKKDFPFTLASIGGTFNSLHQGHKRYIEIAFKSALNVYIQLSSDKLAQEIKHYNVYSYHERLNKLETYLNERGWNGRYSIFILESRAKLREVILDNEFDLAVVEPAYFADFLEYNSYRTGFGKQQLCLIYKPRSVDQLGHDISSAGLMERPELE